MDDLVPLARFERKYAISPRGRIWNKDKECWQPVTQNPNGYWKVLLSLNGKTQCLVHQLVALHFLPNPYGHVQVNHRDGNKANNDVSNLEWVSASENIQHSLEIGLRKGYMSKAEKTKFVNRVLRGELINDIAQEIGRAPESLSSMLRRHADEIGLLDDWQTEMKRRRRDVAVRNLATVNG